MPDDAPLPIHGFGARDYRTFADVRVTGLGAVNVICGPNNSGKSSLLSLLPLVGPAFDAIGTGSSLDHEAPASSGDFEFSMALPLTERATGALLIDGLPPSDGRLLLDRANQVLDLLGEELWLHFRMSGANVVWDVEQTYAPVVSALQQVTPHLVEYEGSVLAAAFGIGGSSTRPAWVEQMVTDVTAPTVLSVADVRRTGDQPLSRENLWRLAQDSFVTTSGRRKEPWTEAFGRILEDVFGAGVRYGVGPKVEDGDFRLSIDGQDEIPLEHVGAGVREVVALTFRALTAPGTTVLAIEEPENCLHPTAARRLIRSLVTHTDVQLFVSTHSAGVVNSEPDCLIHVTREGPRSEARAVVGDADRYAAVRALGYQPSDLVLTPCAVWVEGPSDREYLRTWLRAHHGLEDGIDLHIMFTGGSLATHLSTAAEPLVDDELVAIRKLSRRCVVIVDRDRVAEDAPLKGHVTRFQAELEDDPHGICIVTWGREVENYLDPEVVDAVRAEKGEDPLDRSDVRFRRVIPTDSKFEKLDFARRYLSRTDEVPVAARADVQWIAEFIKRSPEVD